jgi:ribonuclease HIII
MENTIDRKMLDFDITPITLAKIKSQGLTPYYYDGDTDIVEMTGPIKGKTYNTKPKEVYLLTPDEYNKMKKLTDNINEMIELKMKQIELYKQYIPSVADEIIKKK